MPRYAFIPDIHGNPIALDAVLQHLEQQGGAEQFIFMGDYCAIGYDPVGALKRITALPNATFIRGNTDRYTLNVDQQPPQYSPDITDPAAIALCIAVARSFSWTLGAISGAGFAPWLQSLPLAHRFVLPNQTRVLCVHAAPGSDDGRGVRRDHTDEELANILANCNADLVFTAHTHIPLDKTVNGVRVINLGTVSNPHMPDLHAWYGLLEADEQGFRFERHKVAYDHEAVIAAIRASTHPTPDFLISFFELKQISNIFL